MVEQDRTERRSVLRRLRPWLVLVGLALVTALAGGFLWTRALVRRAEEDFPRTGRLVEIEGLAQHVVERGAGPPVVFVHGAYGASQDFAATILDEAAASYRCLLWDRPGHGYSERPAGAVDPGVQAKLLLSLTRRLELERPVLVGFSYGGAVCLAAALEAPGELGGVLLLNAPSHPWPDPLDLEYRLAGVPVLGRLLSETITAPLGTLFGAEAVAQAFHPAEVPQAFGASPLALALRPASYRSNTDDVRALKPFLRASTARYPRLDVPITALVATEDLVVSPTIHLPALVEAAPERVHQIRIEGAGHQLLYTHPDEVLGALRAVVASRGAGELR